MIRTIFAAFLVAGAAGAATAEQAEQQEEIPIIDLRRADGTLAGRAMLYPNRAQIEVRVQAQGLPPGRYAAHIHALGRCEGPSFESAGPHWNPLGREHGTENPEGHHLGDLPNLEVDSEGGGRVEYAIPGVTIRGGQHAIVDVDGAAIVIHADPDDYRTDPAGNSGARIACGVLR